MNTFIETNFITEMKKPCYRVLIPNFIKDFNKSYSYLGDEITKIRIETYDDEDYIVIAPVGNDGKPMKMNKSRVVIPKEIREKMELKIGDKFRIYLNGKGLLALKKEKIENEKRNK